MSEIDSFIDMCEYMVSFAFACAVGCTWTQAHTLDKIPEPLKKYVFCLLLAFHEMIVRLMHINFTIVFVWIFRGFFSSAILLFVRILLAIAKPTIACEWSNKKIQNSIQAYFQIVFTAVYRMVFSVSLVQRRRQSQKVPFQKYCESRKKM